MNKFAFSQRIYSYLLTIYQWYLRTPERSLDKAYQAALEIQAIETEHFKGKKIDPGSVAYTSSVMDYFQSDLKKQLKIIRMRLTEFKGSRVFLNELNKKDFQQLASEYSDSELVLAKLKFIDEVIGKYNSYDHEISSPQTVDSSQNNSKIIPVRESQIIATKSQNLTTQKPEEKQKGKTNTTGVLPRSIFNTINRLQVELDPNAEQDVVQNFRKSQRRTILSVRFLLLLIIVPILTHQLSKAFVVGPIIDHFRTGEGQIFLNYEMEEEALLELQMFKERIEFENLISSAATIFPEADSETGEAVESDKVKDKAREIAAEYRKESGNAVKNVFADICSVFAFIWLLITSKREIAVLKEFFDNVVYGLSDSAKAFIIILFTDIFVGFHSPHGWEVILEGLSRHWGLPGNHSFIFLFIATFPVILDTIFKYWIFRYLNRISPSAVATYHNMNE